MKAYTLPVLLGVDTERTRATGSLGPVPPYKDVSYLARCCNNPPFQSMLDMPGFEFTTRHIAYVVPHIAYVMPLVAYAMPHIGYAMLQISEGSHRSKVVPSKVLPEYTRVVGC